MRFETGFHVHPVSPSWVGCPDVEGYHAPGGFAWAWPVSPGMQHRRDMAEAGKSAAPAQSQTAARAFDPVCAGPDTWRKHVVEK